ncbi:MAG: glucose-1-phosphate cytidylyltransferase [Anaerolineaceae bacterium]|nr:MAG: glucose-1-phosphate cytidylyltransferase [Anaerolineaceae bacterium]
MSMTSLPVVLLVGGSGSRMRADLGDRPKHLVEVGRRPILWHVMRLYSHFGHTNFILPLGHHGEVFRKYFLNFSSLTQDLEFRLGTEDSRIPSSGVEKDWHVNLFDAGIQTSKSDRIRMAINRIDAKTLCVTYGDGIGDIDVNSAIEFHNSHDCIATVTGYRPLSQYGVLDIDNQGRVYSMHEKPRLDHWINAGFFVFDRSVLEYLDGDGKVDLETDVMPKLASDGELMMYKHEGFWASMDTLKDAQNLNNVWNNSAPWKVWGDKND